MAFNHGWSYREQVGTDAVGVPVVDHLVGTRRHSSREMWLDRLQRGEVELGGLHARGDEQLRAGQTIVWHRPAWDEPDVPLHYSVLHEDAALVGVAKPSGLPTMPAGGFLESTLLALVRARYPDARPLHRLGRHTSGVVVFARTRQAYATLSQAWREHAVAKQYRALVKGTPPWHLLDIAATIGPVPHPTLGTVHAATVEGSAAHSTAMVLERRGSTTLLRVAIATGRPHQIRIHLAWTGYPLEGDPLYDVGGVPLSVAPGLPGDGGYWLHAETLRFAHPVSHAAMALHAPPPDELQETLGDAGAEAPALRR